MAPVQHDPALGHRVDVVPVENQAGSKQFATACREDACSYVEVFSVLGSALDARTAHRAATTPAPTP